MMTIRTAFVILFFCTLTIACGNRKDNNKTVYKPGKDEMAELNSYFVQKDRERIQNYIERKKLRMKESQTGLWYEIIKEGSGRKFGEGDNVVFDYDCSLLDGTECYSSRVSGPKKVVLGRSELEQGLNEGIRMLRPGSEAVFIIPPFLGYGLLGDNRKIPPRSVIVYNLYNLRSE
jgi:FKBP-type peptidyl-prolyl cis-trans isomerase FkpA